MLGIATETAESVGNVVHGGERPYDPDLFLEMLEKVSISFDEDGNPQMPTAFVSPETGAHIRAHAAEWEADTAFRERHAKILQRKREEWDDRERHRELVD
jgi:cytochrome c556